jgi:hypothetical protein
MKIGFSNSIHLIIRIIFTVTWTNFLGSGLIIGCLFFNWGCFFTGNVLSSIFWGLFIGSSLNLISQFIFIQICKNEPLPKPYNRQTELRNSTARNFLRESLKRNFDKLSRSQLKEFVVDYVILTQDLVNSSANNSRKSVNLIQTIQATLDSLPSHPESNTEE